MAACSGRTHQQKSVFSVGPLAAAIVRGRFMTRGLSDSKTLSLVLSTGRLRLPLAQVLRLLFKGFEVGAFRVSYSWGSRDGEQRSKGLVRSVAGLFPCCWWDRERLLPGSPVRFLPVWPVVLPVLWPVVRWVVWPVVRWVLWPVVL